MTKSSAPKCCYTFKSAVPLPPANPDAQVGLRSIKSECLWWKPPGISIFKDLQVIPMFGNHCLLDGI